MSTSKQPSSSKTKSSSSKRAASPPPPARRHPDQDLFDAIDSAPEDAAKDMLKSLVSYKLPRDRITFAFLLNNDKDVREPERGGKQRYAVCENCNETFAADHTNTEDACSYHPEELEGNTDSDFWQEQEDAGCGEDIDTPENRKEFPEGFWFPCCEEDGESEGCEVGKHVASVVKVQKKQKR